MAPGRGWVGREAVCTARVLQGPSRDHWQPGPPTFCWQMCSIFFNMSLPLTEWVLESERQGEREQEFQFWISMFR